MAVNNKAVGKPQKNSGFEGRRVLPRHFIANVHRALRGVSAHCDLSDVVIDYTIQAKPVSVLYEDIMVDLYLTFSWR
jgi:hypothetical protein